MRNHSALARARLLALAVPALLLAGAWGSQIFGGLFPCEMCHWQRWPHYAALVPALGAFIVPNGRLRSLLVALAAGLIAISGAIGVFHAGVEYHWWQGLTTCTSTSGHVSIEDLLNAPLIRCDVPQWTMFGISLAGYNAIVSLGGAALIAALLRRGQQA